MFQACLSTYELLELLSGGQCTLARYPGKRWEFADAPRILLVQIDGYGSNPDPPTACP